MEGFLQVFCYRARDETGKSAMEDRKESEDCLHDSRVRLAWAAGSHVKLGGNQCCGGMRRDLSTPAFFLLHSCHVSCLIFFVCLTPLNFTADKASLLPGNT